MFIRSCLISLSVLAALAGGVQAQSVLDAKTAQKQLFSTGKRAIQVRVIPQDFLSDNDIAALNIVGKNLKYYSAIAVSPSSGITGSAAAATSNFHSIEAAREAALAGCNAKREEGDLECVVIAETLPAKYDTPRAFQLNPDATDEFKKKYRRAKAPKAFAISQASGQWGQAVGATSLDAARTAAITACAALTEAEDCTVVSQD